MPSKENSMAQKISALIEIYGEVPVDFLAYECDTDRENIISYLSSAEGQKMLSYDKISGRVISKKTSGQKKYPFFGYISKSFNFE